MISIRRTRVEDAKDLGIVFESAFADYRAAGLAIPSVADGLAEDVLERDVWIAERSSELLGGVILSVKETLAHLVLVAVLPSSKGLGVGRTLIDTAIDYAKSQGVTEVRLGTHSKLTDNVSLYQYLGWTIVEESDDKIAMVRHI